MVSLAVIAVISCTLFTGAALALPAQSYTANGLTVTTSRVFEGHEMRLETFGDISAGEALSPVSTDGLLKYEITVDGENLHGFCTKDGTVVVPAIYESERLGAHFSNGRCKVAVYDPMTATNKWGYIDEHGNMVIAAQFDDAEDFSEGLAAVEVNGKWGYINTAGQMVIPAIYSLAQNFGEGWAYVHDADWNGYINTVGERMLQVKQVPVDTGMGVQMQNAYDGQYKFNDGYAVVIGLHSDYSGSLLLDKSGNLYPLGTDITVTDVYSDGRVPVYKNGMYGAMDANGNLAVPYLYSYMTRFDNGVAVVQQNNRYGVIDVHGNIVVPIEWAFMSSFCNGVGTARFAHDSSSTDNKNGYYVLEVNGAGTSTAPETPVQPSLTAIPTSAHVTVNGEQIIFDAYSIQGNNYFKLRDLAYALSGTDKKFEVSYNAASKAIALTSGADYTPVGGELEGKGEQNKTPVITSSKIILDGAAVQLTAYTIDGNNYFKLRDLGEAFDFGIDWDEASRTIAIDTTSGYTAES